VCVSILADRFTDLIGERFQLVFARLFGAGGGGLSSISRRASVIGWVLFFALVCAGSAMAGEFAPEEVEILHLRSGFPLAGTHMEIGCASCHEGEHFEDVPTRCAGCHTPAGAVPASVPSARHLPSSDDCDACHTEDRWERQAVVEHAAVRGECRRCHDGRVAAGKVRGHVVSGDNCGACHTSPFSFGNARYSHAGIAQPCGDCHNGMAAVGLPPGHMDSATTCNTCHATETWQPKAAIVALSPR